VDETAPWKLAKDASATAALDGVLANLARTVVRLAALAHPFMPARAAALWEALHPGRPLDALHWDDVAGLDLAGQAVARPPILFPKPPTGAQQVVRQ